MAPRQVRNSVRKNHQRAQSRTAIPPAAFSPPSNNFPVIGVGASAGGLEAFTELLHALPKNTGMAFVFVQHLDPKHVSMLAEILGRESKMPVLEARDGVRVEPDHVYVIPRNTSVS